MKVVLLTLSELISLILLEANRVSFVLRLFVERRHQGFSNVAEDILYSKSQGGKGKPGRRVLSAVTSTPETQKQTTNKQVLYTFRRPQRVVALTE